MTEVTMSCDVCLLTGGPFSAPEAALLDINLGRELVYPLADRLRELEIPFVFLTGYSEDAIESRFAGFASVEKPLDRDNLLRAFVHLQ